MVDAEIIAPRLKALTEYTDALRDFVGVTKEELERDLKTRWTVLHGLQVSIGCVQDIAAHLIATRGLGSPTNHTDAIDLLAEAGLISADLGGRIRGMPGFRNVVVHEYLSVNLDLVHSSFVSSKTLKSSLVQSCPFWSRKPSRGPRLRSA